MSVTTKQLEALAAPTPKEEIGLIPGKGGSGKLSYVTARFVQNRLDDSVGPENWQSAFALIGGSLTCAITIYIGGRWISKQDVGSESQIEAEKGSFSDAFKRAAVQWGIARDLYPGPKNTVSKDEEEKAQRDERKAARSTAEGAEVHWGHDSDDKAEKATAEVVGNSGLTQKQKSLLFASLKSAGLAKKRKSAVFLMTSKNSIKDMDSEDLDRALAIMDYGRDGEGKFGSDSPSSEDFDTVWENINSVSEDSSS